MLGRICEKSGVNKVNYTVHGLHFYKGVTLLNRTVLKWAEQIMIHMTGAIIIMNQEDYEATQKFKFCKNGKVYYVLGVRIDTARYHSDEQSRFEKLKELVFLMMASFEFHR